MADAEEVIRNLGIVEEAAKEFEVISRRRPKFARLRRTPETRSRLRALHEELYALAERLERADLDRRLSPVEDIFLCIVS